MMKSIPKIGVMTTETNGVLGSGVQAPLRGSMGVGYGVWVCGCVGCRPRFAWTKTGVLPHHKAAMEEIMAKATVVGRIDLSKVIKVKNTHDHEASDHVVNATKALRHHRVAIVDMAHKNIKLVMGARKMGLKLLSHVDALKKAGYAVLNA